MKSEHMKSDYKTLSVMLIIHFFVMLALMYAMVNSFSEVYLHLNQVYMALLMAAPMTFSMLLLMPSMYPNKKLNFIFYLTSGLALVLSFVFVQRQVLIGDKQFLRSMIPHHSGAVLMCGKASISDPEIGKLCGQIMESQTREIDQMKRILERL